MKLRLRRTFFQGKGKIVSAIVIISIMSLGGVWYSIENRNDEGGVSKINTDFSTYKNNFKLNDEWEDYGIGDPYILRYNGRYYLYCSTKDYKKGVKSWSSEDLISWKYEGSVTDEEISTGSYAPEVVYWNGYFYMYTSPAGKGHYVLKSDKPTGPFTVQTDNFGLSIDGSVFIDDDGKFYFTHAGDNGIIGHEMTDPLTVDKTGKNLNAYLNGWTEGSMIIKHNGLYYLTYTGNHVFSKGYRINYGVAEDSPIGKYTVPDNNPIVISTEDDFNGLGHSSTVLGPDMDSYYIVYHNLLGASKEGPPIREMNIDRLVFNGERMSVLGPTNYEQPAPRMPDFYTWLQSESAYSNIEKTTDKDNSISLIDRTTDSSYTAEYNFSIKDDSKILGDSKVGAIFSYNNESNYMYTSVNLNTKKLELYEVSDGNHKLDAAAQLPEEFDFKKLHSIRVERMNNSVRIFFDNMMKISTKVTGIPEGKIGYIYKNLEPIFDYIAFTNSVNGLTDYDAFKPIPGKIEAVHFMKNKETGYHTDKTDKKDDSYRNDSEIETNINADKSYSVVLNEDEWLNYNINVKDDGTFGFDFMAKQIGENASVQLYVDGAKKGSYKVSTDGPIDEDGWTKVQVGQLNLLKGFHQLKVKVSKGMLNLKWMEFYKLDKLKETSFDQLTFYGTWLNNDGEFSTASSGPLKAYGGSANWGDYEVEGDIKLNSDKDTDGTGIMFRVTNESSFKLQVQDSFMGYRIRLAKDSLILDKVNYGSYTVKTAYANITADEYNHIKISIENGNIKVYIGDMKKPILEYNDCNAFMYGKIGIQTDNNEVSFKNIIVKPIK
ncbi:family 43 glycosylhydrolase [Clostridium beijerinckii]|uniref:family 43 glycosylhydrolase n=1 Tax=Clostridium beijerinckii TaxID=1520 RepID=UPI0009BF76DF|nr:family 43 glycosylhydrolase [Clostridium beijerinckii]